MHYVLAAFSLTISQNAKTTYYIVTVEWQSKTKFLDEQKQIIFGKQFTKSSRNAGNVLETIENLSQSTVAKAFPVTGATWRRNQNLKAKKNQTWFNDASKTLCKKLRHLLRFRKLPQIYHHKKNKNFHDGNNPFIISETRSTVQLLKTNKAPGPVNIISEIIKGSSTDI